MSLPWRSELRLELRQRHCDAALANGPWPLRARRRVRVHGDTPNTLAQAVQALRADAQAAKSQALPSRARLTVPDERVFYALVDADGSWHAQRARVQDHFAELLDRRELALQATLLPGGRRWLVAALDAVDLRHWNDALAAIGIGLAHVHPALIEDLRRMAAQPIHASAMVVLLRDEGAMFLRLRDGVPGALSWERFGTAHAAALSRRVHAFELSTPADVPDAPVVVVPGSTEQYRALIDTATAAHWQLWRPFEVAQPAARAA